MNISRPNKFDKGNLYNININLDNRFKPNSMFNYNFYKKLTINLQNLGSFHLFIIAPEAEWMNTS